MSLFTIPSTIFGYAKSAVKRLPGLLRLRKEPETAESSINTFKIPLNNFTQTKTDDPKMTFDVATKLKARELINQIEINDPNIEDGTEDFRRIIFENIRPEKSAGVQNIVYNVIPLENQLKDFINQREQDYIRRMDETLSLNKDDDIKDFTYYDEVFSNFFIENLTLLHNLNNIIFHRIVGTEDFKASDLDLAKAFRHTQDLTKVLSEKILDDFQILLLKLPIKEGFEDDTKQYIEQVKESFKDSTEILLQGKHRGILDKNFVEAYMSHYLEKVDKGEHLSNTDLANLRQFHEGTHGSLLLQPKSERNVIASLDTAIIKSIVKDLNEQIISLSQIKTSSASDQKRRAQIDYRIANIIKNIAEIARTETRVSESLELFSQDATAVQLGIPGEKIVRMRKAYEDIAQTENYIGRTKEDMIVGRAVDGTVSHQTFQEKTLTNIFTLRAGPEASKKSYSINFSKQYERLVLETSLVAGYHALAQQRDQMSDKKREAFFKKPEFANFDQEHVPWLKGFYEKELKKYQQIIENDKSSRKTADLAISMCNLCQRLASPDIDIYQSNDFFRRYNLQKIAEAAMERVGGMTDVNTMSLALKVYSEIFSNLEQDAEAANLTKTETKWLSTHVEYLKSLAEIKDPNGKIVYAPADGNPYEQEKYNELEAIFRDTDLVPYNIDLILKYFTNAINAKRKTNKSIKDHSDLNSRNLLLSSALMYYYLKFMPESSKNADSLRSREKVIELFFDPNFGTSRNLPDKLGPKMLDHFLGTESNEKGLPVSQANYNRQGFLRSYALELEDKLENHIQGKDYKRISLPNLLNAYYRLEQIKTKSIQREHTRNPANVDKDISTIDDLKLGLWSRQEKSHNEFHNGKQRPLLPPLKLKLKELLKEHSSDVMKFISTIPDEKNKQEVSEFIARELFKQAADSTKEILNYRENNIIEVTDDNKELLTTIVSTLGNLSRIANLIYKGNLSKFSLAENSILGEDNRTEFTQNLKTVQSLLKSKFLLVDVVNKTGEKVRRVKDIALNLLKAFNIRPEIGNHLQWMTENQVEHYIDKQQTLKSNDYPSKSSNSSSRTAMAA